MRTIRSLVAIAALAMALAASDVGAADPPAAVDCSCWTSDTLTDLGITVMADPSCINDGQGCVGTTCRFCRTKDTTESLMYKPCSAISATPSPAPSKLPAPVAVTPSVSATILPASVDACAPWLSEGDRTAGIDVAGDTSCVRGGVGCIGIQCRYCRARDTPQSHHFLECNAVRGVASSPQSPAAPSPTATSAGADACTKWLSSGDRSVGVNIFSDATCGTGGVGCIGGTTCRYCRAKDSDQSKNFVSCPGSSPAAPTIPTQPQASAAGGETCAKFSTSGDRSVGIQVVSDVSCANGGVGCIGGACRFCRTTNTTQSQHLLPCTGLPSGSAVVRVEALSVEATTTQDGTQTGAEAEGLVVAAMVVAGAAAIIGVLAFAAKTKARWYNQALAAPMCIEQRRASLSGI